MSPILSVGPARFLAAGSLLALAVGFAGCAHTYNVRIDALHNPDVTGGATYRIVAKDDLKSDFDQNYAQTVALVETALAVKGLHLADNPRDADVIIEVDYGIGSRRRTVTHEPSLFSTFEPAKRSSSGTNTLVPGAPVTQPEANQPVQARIAVVTFYEKFVTLSARETVRATHGQRPPVELWRVTATVEDEKKTMDECMPVLVTTASEKIGTTSLRRELVRRSEKTPAIVATNSDL